MTADDHEKPCPRRGCTRTAYVLEVGVLNDVLVHYWGCPQGHVWREEDAGHEEPTLDV